jgi:hypothetical protein
VTRGALLAAVALTCGAAALPAPAGAGEIELRYAVHVGGLHVFDAVVDATLGANRYEMAVEANSRGVADWLAPYRGRSAVRGTLAAGAPRPEGYRSDRTFRGEGRTVTLGYAAGGAETRVEDRVEPAEARRDRDPVPDPMKPGTVDPLSAGLALLLRAGEAGRCGTDARVFDGLARYDLSAADRGAARLAPTRYGVYAGEARRCAVEHRMLAGFWRGRPSAAAPSSAEEGRERPPASVWLAPIGPGGLPIPVRAEAEGWFGAVVIHLVGARGIDAAPVAGAAR